MRLYWPLQYILPGCGHLLKKTPVCYVFENNCLRSILSINFIKQNIDGSRKMADIKYDIENFIRKRRLTWFRHVCRISDDSLVIKSLKDFKKKRGWGTPPKRKQISSNKICPCPSPLQKICKRPPQIEKTCEFKLGETYSGMRWKVIYSSI